MATCKITPSLSVVPEGQTISSTVVTTGLANGAKVYWSLSGTNVNAADFTSKISDVGTVLVPKGSTTGSLKISHGIAADGLLEGNELVTIKVFQDQKQTIQLGSATFTIKDLVAAGAPATKPVVAPVVPSPGAIAPVATAAPATELYKPQFTPFTVEKWKSPLPVPPIKQPFSVGSFPGPNVQSPAEWQQADSAHLLSPGPASIDVGGNPGQPRPASSNGKAGQTISIFNVQNPGGVDPGQTHYGGQAPGLWNPNIPATAKDPQRPYYTNGDPIQWYEQVEASGKQVVVDTPGTQQLQTPIYGYDGIFPGPTFKTKVAAPVVVRHWNKLDRYPTLPAGMYQREGVHLHGNHGNSFSDGYPSFVMNPGMHRDYYYANTVPFIKVPDPAKPGTQKEVPDFGESPSTMWYHDHGEDVTDLNVVMGLAGFWLSYDDQELNLIKTGVLPGADAGGGTGAAFNEKQFLANNSKYDVPLAISDRRFNADGSFYYQGFPIGGNGDGYLGDVMLVNGKSYPYMNVDRAQYRFRLLGASTGRIFKLHFEDATGKTVGHLRIGNDTWLNEKALSMNDLTLSMAQRADLIMDFSGIAPGTEVFLVNTADQTSGRGPSGTLDNLGLGGTFKEKIMKFVVGNTAATTSTLPAMVASHTDPVLRENTPIQQSEIARTRTFDFGRSGGSWVVNQTGFDAHRSDNPQQLGDAEEWILKNGSGGWWHPIHIHLESHQLKDINGVAPSPTYWPDKQWKSDTTLLGPNTTAKVWMKFRTFEGAFVSHCHNLVHEDSMMMFNFDPTANLSPSYTPGSPIPAEKDFTPAKYDHFHHLTAAAGVPAVALKGAAKGKGLGADALGKRKGKGKAKHLHHHVQPKAESQLASADAAPTDIPQELLASFSKSTWGTNEADTLAAGQGDEYLNGRSGDDLMTGSATQDVLVGGDGDDDINGGAGDDVIAGELGSDRLTGGDGKDLFRYISMDPGHTDVITDFKGGEDQICFNLALVNTNGKNTPGWTYIKDKPFSGEVGEVRFDAGLLQADLNGDGRSDVAAQLLGVMSFSADWIAPFNPGTHA